MQLRNLPSSFLFVASIPLSHAATLSTSATKDSTILLSTVSCTACPQNICNKCTLGHKDTLEAKSGGLSYVRMLIGFQLPVASSQITQCTVQLGQLTQPLQLSVNATVAQAMPSDWDEASVTGESAPGSGEPFHSVAVVPSTTQIEPIDITQACRNAAADGRFSIYVGTSSGRMEIWSADSGHPAWLYIAHT